MSAGDMASLVGKVAALAVAVLAALKGDGIVAIAALSIMFLWSIFETI